MKGDRPRAPVPLIEAKVNSYVLWSFCKDFIEGHFFFKFK